MGSAVSRAGRWILLPVLLTYGCADASRKSAYAIIRTETVERQVPVAVPCSGRVKRHLESLLNEQAETPQPEGKVEAVTRSDSEQRKCGVVIE